MRSTLNAIIIFFIVMPMLLISYQLGSKSVSRADITNYLNQPAIGSLSSILKADAIAPPKPPQRIPNTPDLELNAATALSWDFKNDFYFFSQNIDSSRPIASLTKLITAAVVIDRASLDDLVTVSHQAIIQEGDQGELKEGEILTVRDLLAAALLESSNDAAYALAEYIGARIAANPDYPVPPIRTFVRAMNEKMNSLGLVNTNFADVTGLSDKSFSTARDLAAFIKYLRTNSAYNEIWGLASKTDYSTESRNGLGRHEFKSTDPFFSEFNDIIGGKTGYTNAALGNMMLVLKGPQDTEIVYLIMGSTDRFGDMRKLVNWANTSWQWPDNNK